MIVWLNGTVGCGKTTTITAGLRSLIPSSRLFDPETVGYVLRPSLADHPVSGFQHLATVAAAGGGYSHGIGAFTGQHLIAPQNPDPCLLEQIFADLREAGLPVFHIVLDADEELLPRRIQGSPEGCSGYEDRKAIDRTTSGMTACSQEP